MIVVTTPTGRIGSQVVDKLIASRKRLRLITRYPAGLTPRIRENVEVIQGSHGDREIIEKALESADALFWCVPPAPGLTAETGYLAFTRPAAEAVQRQRTCHVVVVTALGRGTRWQHRAGLVTASIRMVDLFRATGNPVRGLAMPEFMENLLRQLDGIRAGHISGPYHPDTKLPHTATADVATVAARLLTDLSWSGQEDVAVLGPDRLSFNEIASIISDVIKTDLKYSRISLHDLRHRLTSRGMSRDLARDYIAMLRAKNEGMDDAAKYGAEVTGSVSFRGWVESVLLPAIRAQE